MGRQLSAQRQLSLTGQSPAPSTKLWSVAPPAMFRARPKRNHDRFRTVILCEGNDNQRPFEPAVTPARRAYRRVRSPVVTPQEAANISSQLRRDDVANHLMAREIRSGPSLTS